jgi:DNA-binding NarL/FixJ family response regulator
MLLDLEADIEVVACVIDSAALVGAVGEHEPSAVIVDADADDFQHAEALAALVRRYPTVRLIGLYDQRDGASAARATGTGIRCLVAREGGLPAILDALRASTPAMSPHQPLLQLKTATSLDRPRLTTRELEVLRCIGAGMVTKETAVHLGISPKTVENHKQRIFAKLKVRNQAHAVSVAIRMGLLPAAAAQPVA